jgi:arsenite-transporting ATPase
MLKPHLDLSPAKLIMIGGKGGVGKTTCASAIAFHCARLGQKTLLISSDPTPSLSDIYEVDIGEKEKQIPGVANLYGMEVSSRVIRQCWKERFGPEIYEVLTAFSNLDYDFVDYIGEAPGIEEEYMLHFIVELVEKGSYDRLVWDTAPAGHTLRLLQLPQIFLTHLEAAAKFYVNLYGAFEKIASTVRLKKSKRSLLQIIAGWQELSLKILDFIRDGQHAAYVIVTIAEGLGVRLTERLVQDFEAFRLNVGHLIINSLIREADCPFHQRRQAMQERYLRQLKDTYGQRMAIIEVPLLADEVKGIRRIRDVADLLFPAGKESSRKR